MKEIILTSIGYEIIEDEQYKILVNENYRSRLMSLEEETDIQILWSFHDCKKEIERNSLVEISPYKDGPDKLGVFATRSPNRPNPIVLTTATILSMDIDQGVIIVNYFDCFQYLI